MADDGLLEFDRVQDSENVVAFRRREAADDQEGAAFVRAAPATCRHGRFIVDEKQRTVQCGECRTWLDPVWVLLQFVRFEEGLKRRRESVEAMERAQRDRQTRAIALRQQRTEKAKREQVAANCKACDGTGWRPSRVKGHDGRIAPGVERCECRRSGARLV